MGVNLSGMIEPDTVELSDLCGKAIAIDAYNTIYQFLSVIRQSDGTSLSDSKGRVTSHLSGLLPRTTNLVSAGIEPVFVFDGKPHPLKAATLADRKMRRELAMEEWEQALEEGDMKKAFSKAQQTSKMTPEIRQSSMDLIERLGFPIIHAPSDGEAQAAYMCMKGDVWASASQDYDSLLFGAPTLVRNVTITGRRKLPGKDKYRDVKPEVIGSKGFLESLGISREQLVDMCILMGTDFNEGIPGIGPKKGLKLVKENGSLESILPKIGVEIPLYEDIRGIFLDGIYVDDYDISPKEVDVEGVLDLLQGYDFTEDRVRFSLNRMATSRKAVKAKMAQRSLDSWF